jgi:hypothetical protein
LFVNEEKGKFLSLFKCSSLTNAKFVTIILVLVGERRKRKKNEKFAHLHEGVLGEFERRKTKFLY